ncbi:type IX secretion system motor protein PorM/GldM [Catalinimonas niigatensis]|uniref:type IX secretion system motor protein PorM/GldM n=1 Tax=Catalinimonas niigatensis TaxID=1397264 RepID=UPI0026669635|nr:gliding motility protein GldM [Catalinimonas niigatensis]WPP53138.1 gliding motility protein GldM [Catalinimonas niigatensis]
MAGGKETPRQKMIGMMYLVLTALLALQVSNTVLEKFIFIDNSLEQSADGAKNQNGSTVDRIQSAVTDAGNRKEDVAVLEKAREVRAKTNQVLNALDSLKEEFVVVTGGVEEDGTYVGGKSEDEIADIMVRQGKGEELKKALNTYASYLASATGTEVAPIALDAIENPVFKDNPEQNMKTFSEITFQNTPMVAGLASLSQLKNEVLSRETIALDHLARQVGAADMKFDNIVAMVRPESNVVAAGTKYKADLFIAASSSAVDPVMTVDGKSIPVNGGMGQIEFTASADKYDADNRAERSFKAAITVEQGSNKETYEETFNYFVTKPVIQVQTASVQRLYLNCGNELQINVPALGTAYDPSFSAQGATAVKGQKTGAVTVIPKAPKVTLSVSSGGYSIGNETFDVVRVPKPTIAVKGPGGGLVNMQKGESASRLRTIKVEAIPDENFASFLPKDARYRVAEAEIILARGSRPIDKTTLSNETANLSRMMSQAKEGDRLVIEIKKVQRMNFKNEVEEVPLGASESFYNVPLN